MNKQIIPQIISVRVDEINAHTFSAEEWHILAHQAQVEGVGAILFEILSKLEIYPSIPEQTRNFLRMLHAGTRIENKIIFDELADLSRLFDQANIPVVALKGVCFALTVYADFGLRPMGDIDLLVPKEKLTEAVEIAKSRGYQIYKPEASSGLWKLLNHDVCLQKNGHQPIMLELHHSLVADKTFSYAVPVDWFWAQTELLKPLSSEMVFENLLMLKPEAQILYAASHAILQHGESNAPLRWFYDIDRLICQSGANLNWDLLLSQAKIFEWGSATNAFLTQIVDYFDTPIPEDVLRSFSAISDRHQKLIAQKKVSATSTILSERQRLLSLNLYGRFRLVLALLMPARDYMRWRYQFKSAWKLPFYYLLRWWGIFKELLRTLFSN